MIKCARRQELEAVEAELASLNKMLKALPDHPHSHIIAWEATRRTTQLEDRRRELDNMLKDISRLSAYEMVHQRLPCMRYRVSERSSQSKTRAARPRTFGTLLLWDGFEPGVRDLIAWLAEHHNDDPLHNNVIRDQELLSAADEAEVRGYIFRFIAPLGDLARTLNIDCEYVGGGSNRSVSFTDLLMRHPGITDKAHPGRLNMATIEVKGSWQLPLSPGQDLVEALKDDKLRKDIIPVLQQAYGDAVAEETPFLVLSNYDVTYFIKRNVSDPADKRLWISPPVAWNDERVPPLAAWLYLMSSGYKLWADDVKATLAAEKVPSTPPEGYEVDEDLTANCRWRHGQDKAGPRRQPLRRAASRSSSYAGDAADDATIAYASSSSGGGSSSDHTAASEVYNQAGDGHEDRHAASQEVTPGGGSSDSGSNCFLEVEAWPISELKDLGWPGQFVASTSTRRVMKGRIGEDAVAIKYCDPSSEEDVRCLLHEASCYERLAALQGQAIPRLVKVGRLAHMGAPFLASQWAEPVQRLNPELHDKALDSLTALHQAGFIHNDVCLANILLAGDRVLLCDLESCDDYQEGRNHDHAALESMLVSEGA
mmetsp:Transcript_5430/g.12010  ORF Transcript_5430/g.12010 Transcript_5430/m.12010 type:complete len:596 (+) Transcript_5430:322-2109(+)|eukprot:CAMPEP_0202902190 /NCGR_PEP_ID=MMETSP1392-20130828/16710_1 /ASSEMBLY_ACC=CAM_ASM_000868 /TAXON_ID=225041 /ORGANISM="Chlamydomonas chlamydogama, Strain SAG 11-48b" /LENGTH=595 /DNA_ID=CAMNT_0049588919 /DNA_START=322 /DNA_END=2109 /DNA_ORIENTATION=-